MRLVAAGAQIQLDRNLLGTHVKSWRLRDMVWTDLRYRGAPWISVLVARRSIPATLNLGWRHRVSALTSLFLAGAIAKTSLRLALPALLLLVGLNRSFYKLIGRRGGLVLTALGPPLHVIHHLTAVLAVPLGLLAYLRGKQRAPRRVVREPSRAMGEHESAALYQSEALPEQSPPASSGESPPTVGVGIPSRSP